MRIIFLVGCVGTVALNETTTTSQCKPQPQIHPADPFEAMETRCIWTTNATLSI